MATTDYATSEIFRRARPHTHNALTKLVLAMAKLVSSQGKKTWLGKDKQVLAYRTFQERLSETLTAMTLDGLISDAASDADAALAVYRQIQQFSVIYPNWADAYSFAQLFWGRGEFSHSPFDATAVIGRLR